MEFVYANFSNILERLLENVDDIKQKINDEEYRQLMNNLQTLHQYKTNKDLYIVKYLEYFHKVVSVEGDADIVIESEQREGIFNLSPAIKRFYDNEIIKNKILPITINFKKNMIEDGTTLRYCSFMLDEDNKLVEQDADKRGLTYHRWKVVEIIPMD